MSRRSVFLALIVGALAYLFLWPVPVDPEPVQPPAPPPLDGPLAPNDRLAAVELLPAGHGPEAVFVDSAGRVYTGLSDGRIRRAEPGGAFEDLVDTGGRPLEMIFDAEGRLVVADAERGLLRIDLDTDPPALETLAGPRLLNFADALDLAPDGSIYVTDASAVFGMEEYALDALDHGPNGRLFRIVPGSGRAEIVVDSLRFANGVSLTHDRRSVLVVETWRYRVLEYAIAGPDSGQTRVFAGNLPGFPDNITRDDRGGYWVGLTNGPKARRNYDFMLPRPWIRRIVARLPAWVSKAVQRPQGFAVRLDAEGRITESVQDLSGTYFAHTSHALERDGVLYLGSLHGRAIGRLDYRNAHQP
ncbi:MAG: SMP-30/gluconolactonase/LRE family protein [Bacteroidota bacterium]